MPGPTSISTRRVTPCAATPRRCLRPRAASCSSRRSRARSRRRRSRDAHVRGDAHDPGQRGVHGAGDACPARGLRRARRALGYLAVRRRRRDRRPHGDDLVDRNDPQPEQAPLARARLRPAGRGRGMDCLARRSQGDPRGRALDPRHSRCPPAYGLAFARRVRPRRRTGRSRAGGRDLSVQSRVSGGNIMITVMDRAQQRLPRATGLLRGRTRGPHALRGGAQRERSAVKMTMMVEPLPQANPRRSGVGEMYTIATLGSHSALQILKGARDEGFGTLAIASRETARLYSSYSFIDEVITISKYSDFMGLVPELEKRKIIIVPHGSFVAYLSLDEHKKMNIPYFGNKAVLDWEASRELQRDWLLRAGLKLPRQFKTGAEIDRPVIVKLYGAQGGKGYMFLRAVQLDD